MNPTRSGDDEGCSVIEQCVFIFFWVAEGMFQSVPEKGLVIIQLESCISNKKWQEIPEKIGVSSNFSIKPSQ